MQIEIKQLPARMISNDRPRRAPLPPSTIGPALSMKSERSEDTLLHMNENDGLKEELELMDLELPSEHSKATVEIDALRTKVQLLELKLEEMTQKIHVVPQRMSLILDAAMAQ